MLKRSALFTFTTLSLVGAASGYNTSTSKARPAVVIDDLPAFAHSKFKFAIKPNDLIQRAKEVLGPDISVGTKDSGECLADDFEFCAAVVGPISKEEYLTALGTFNLEDSFKIQQNLFGFSVDPVQNNRVWFFQRQVGTHLKEFAGVKAEGKVLFLPPQIFHLDFNEDGKVKELGFYTCDRRQGNTGGLGGAFGFFYGVGKNLGFPEAMPYKPSFRYRMIQKIGVLARKMENPKKAEK
jgi:hypothetical protein